MMTDMQNGERGPGTPRHRIGEKILAAADRIVAPRSVSAPAPPGGPAPPGDRRLRLQCPAVLEAPRRLLTVDRVPGTHQPASLGRGQPI